MSLYLNKFKNTLIVDGLNLAFRYRFQKIKVFAEQYIELINSLATSYRADKVILLGDGRSHYRKEIYPDYKANRVYDDDGDFQEFINEFKRACSLCNFCYIRFDDCEADDIAAYIVKNYDDILKHIWLISSDKDWDLLINENTSRFSFLTRKEITKDNWDKHYDTSIDKLISHKVLRGDTGDNIPGVPGIGEKRAYNLLREYDSAFDIYDSLPIDSKYKFIKNLNEFGDNLLLNYQLMDLLSYCEEALGEENITEINKKIGEHFNEI